MVTIAERQGDEEQLQYWRERRAATREEAERAVTEELLDEGEPDLAALWLGTQRGET